MSLSYRSFVGEEIAAVIEGLARLRIEVFREWPYLYDGDLEYERRYLQGYAHGRNLLVAAFEDRQMVGAATGMPLSEVTSAFSEPLSNLKFDISDAFYCAESVLLSEFRGQGAGRVFFDRREAHARELGALVSTFCAVVRSPDHPMRPSDYRPLDGFWRGRGYGPLDGATAALSWRDIGDASETPKILQFWSRRL